MTKNRRIMISNMNKYQEDEFIVAFIDVLGAKEAINKDSEGALNLIHAAYDDALRTFRKIRNELHNNLYIKDLKYKIFSDNIIIALPKRKKLCNMIYSISIFSAILQLYFIKHRFLTRGGIAMGKFFIDEVMVCGKALVSAYKLESKHARYPRVLIDRDLIDSSSFSKYEKENLFRVIKKDTDDYYFVNYLGKTFDSEFRDFIDDLVVFRNSKEKLLEKIEMENDNCNEKASIAPKIKWYVSYSRECRI